MEKREIKYYVLIFALVSTYLYLIHNVVEMPPFANAVTNMLALVSAVTFWLQLKRTERINEASYIMNLNNQFITNKELIEVERDLMVYYEKTKEGIEAELHSDYQIIGTCKRQALINYLVYLEAMAAVVQQGAMHLDVIDDLFAYRFFIAINNPDVQTIELKPSRIFYQGCYALADMWTRRMIKQEWEIPMDDEYALKNTKEAEEMRKRRTVRWRLKHLL